jgi:hypothetical protein
MRRGYVRNTVSHYERVSGQWKWLVCWWYLWVVPERQLTWWNLILNFWSMNECHKTHIHTHQTMVLCSSFATAVDVWWIVIMLEIHHLVIAPLLSHTSGITNALWNANAVSTELRMSSPSEILLYNVYSCLFRQPWTIGVLFVVQKWAENSSSRKWLLQFLYPRIIHFMDHSPTSRFVGNDDCSTKKDLLNVLYFWLDMCSGPSNCSIIMYSATWNLIAATT